jgi:hypothetical protein
MVRRRVAKRGWAFQAEPAPGGLQQFNIDAKRAQATESWRDRIIKAKRVEATESWQDRIIDVASAEDIEVPANAKSSGGVPGSLYVYDSVLP